MFDPSTHELMHLLTVYGYWVVLAFVAFESMGVPVPGETILLASAVYAGTTHRLSIALVIAAAAAGAIIGDNLGFLAGQTGGRRLVHRYGKYMRLDDRKLRLGEYLFERHGGKVVFFGRFVPVLRIWAAFLAGTNRMSWRRFLAYNAGGGAVWATAMGMAAYTMGDAVTRSGTTLCLVIPVLATALMVVLTLALRRGERRLQQEADRRICVPAPMGA